VNIQEYTEGFVMAAILVFMLLIFHDRIKLKYPLINKKQKFEIEVKVKLSLCFSLLSITPLRRIGGVYVLIHAFGNSALHGSE
jgi:uncharacterized protein (UPF0262 family)